MLSVFGLIEIARVLRPAQAREGDGSPAGGSFSLSRTFVVLVLRYGCGLHMLSWAIVRRLFVPAGPVSRSGRKSRLIEGGFGSLPAFSFGARVRSFFGLVPLPLGKDRLKLVSAHLHPWMFL